MNQSWLIAARRRERGRRAAWPWRPVQWQPNHRTICCSARNAPASSERTNASSSVTTTSMFTRRSPVHSRERSIANEHVYAVLSARGHLYADLAQDDADALLALHLADSPAPLDAPQDAGGATLPPSHPIHQLVRKAAWLATHLPLAA